MATGAAKSSARTRPVRRAILLNINDTGTDVVVEPENEDRFVLSMREAAVACQQHKQEQEFEEQFRRLLSRLARWKEEHNDKCEGAFVTIRDGGLIFLFIRNSVPFDPDLENDLVALDLEIAQDNTFNLIDLNVLGLPKSSPEAYETFLVPGCVWAYGAN